jgi:hypothetical protein
MTRMLSIKTVARELTSTGKWKVTIVRAVIGPPRIVGLWIDGYVGGPQVDIVFDGDLSREAVVTWWHTGHSDRHMHTVRYTINGKSSIHHMTADVALWYPVASVTPEDVTAIKLLKQLVQVLQQDKD